MASFEFSDTTVSNKQRRGIPISKLRNNLSDVTNCPSAEERRPSKAKGPPLGGPFDWLAKRDHSLSGPEPTPTA
jgi:hypothetical protein